MNKLYLLTNTQSLRNKVDTFVQLPMETIEEDLECFNEYMRAEFLGGISVYLRGGWRRWR
jgi:hypothetical protein